MSFQVEVQARGDILVVHMSGELDHHTAELVRNQVDKELSLHDSQHIIMNLSGLTFMDSSGLGVILGRYKRVTQSGGKMAITNVDPGVRRLFEMAGLLKIIQFYDTQDLALQAVGGAV